MALKPLNSVGGFSVGEVPANVILANADITANKGTFTGNLAVSNSNPAYGILTDNLYYANGQPWDLQEAAGSNTQVQFNNNNNFGASANFTFDSSTNILAVTGNINATNANIGSGNIDLYANGEINTTGLITTSANVDANNINVSNVLSGNTANFTGNITAQNFIGNISGNLTISAPNTAIIYSANGAAVGSNAFTWDYSGNVLTVDGTANITGNTEVGAILTDNYYYANGAPVDFQQPAGSNTQIQFNDDDDFGASANLTFDFSTNTLAVAGLVDITGNANVSDTINGNVANFSGNLTSLNANLGNLATANYVNVANDLNGNVANFSGNLTAANANLGNLAVANFVDVSSNLVASNLTVNLELAGNTANFTGNITSLNANLGNLAQANYVNVANDLNGNVANFTGNLTAANAALGNLATANYVNVANDLNVVGNVNAGNLVGPLANGTSNVRVFQDANVEISVAGNANVATVTGTGFLVAGNIQATTGSMLANGNVTANGFLVGANASVTGEANVGSLKTANITATTGDISINAGANGTIDLIPNGSGTVSVNGFRITQVPDPVDPLDATNKEYVDALAGEGLVIHTPVRVEAESALNATYAQGGTTPTVTDIQNTTDIVFSASHGLSVNDGIVFTNSFNGLTGGEAYWVYNVVNATTIQIKDGYFGAQVTGLTNGTGLTQASRANPGVGATLTNAGANAALSIDGISLSTSDRVLVYTQASAYENGIYEVTTVGDGSTAWVLTRTTDFDKYIPGSSVGVGKGSYVFVQQGLTGAGESYVMTAPSGEVIIGTDNITFTQFSAAGAYTAGNGIAITGTTISANTDGVTTAIVSGNIVVKASANLTTPNIGDATFSSLTWNTLSNGNVSANNLSIGNIANIGVDLTVGGNIQANGTISSNANVSGLNLTTTGNVEAGANVLSNNVTANTLLTVPTANVSNIVNAGNVTITNELSGNTANFSGNVVVPNLTVNLALTGNTANFSGNVVLPNLTVNLELVGNTANFSGNVVLPNLTVNNNIAGNTANFSGNISAANANLGNLVTANFFTGTLINGNSNVAIPTVDGNVNITANGNTSFTVTETGANVSGNLGISGNLSANNFSANTADISNSIGLGNTSIKWGTVTTTAITANQAIAQAPYSGVTGVDFIIKGEDSSGAKYSMAHVTAVTDGTTVDYTTYGTVYLGGTTGTLSVAISGSNLVLQVTPSSSNSTIWTTQYRLV